MALAHRWRGAVVLALVISLHHWGTSVAVVACLGSLTFAALRVGALLSYAPRNLTAVVLAGHGQHWHKLVRRFKNKSG